MPSTEAGASPEDEDLSEEEALQRMYRITVDHQRPFEEKLRDLLVLGRTFLGVETGFLTEISEGTQVIVQASGDHELLQPGESCPLSSAYCRKTVQRDSALAVQHAAIEGWEGDTAYEAFGLESYVGAKVIVDGEIYGTFCFADSEPRDRPFTAVEETFVELMAEWVSYELFQQQAIERIEHQRDQLEEFTSVVSHDLRNPLSAAQTYLELAEETGDREHFQRCQDALDRMNALIDDLLALAREGEPIAETEKIALAELVTECWSFVANAEGNATVEATTDLALEGDESRLRQLFENLLRNAIEHGGPAVTVRVGDLADGFYVEDDGPGIPPEDREEVFDDGYSTGESGTGFGLSIVKRVANAHGWEVAVTESADGGARFEFTGVDGADAA